MPYIEVTYQRNVSRQVVSGIVDTLDNKASQKDFVSAETPDMDVYARKLGKLDRQAKLIMVRIHVGYRDDASSRQDASRIKDEVWSKLSEQVKLMQIGVEVIIAPASA